jgi:hypothetical protein
VLEVVARLILGGLLAGTALAKLAGPRSSRSALATFGVSDASAQWVVWATVVATELGLGVGVIAGADVAAVGAAGLMLAFAGLLVGAIMRGRAGAPCACFGARSTVGWPQVARNLGLAAAFAAIPFLPEGDPSTDEWLAVGLAVALLACGGLAIAVLALAREVGMLRLRLGPEGALEIAEEGPALGSRSPVIERFEAKPDAELALAVFTADGCRVCAALEPAVAGLARDPVLTVMSFEEKAHAGVWEELGIPGSPFAVALDLAGTVLAKGTFNNLAQLESVLHAAERRRADRQVLESLVG